MFSAAKPSKDDQLTFIGRTASDDDALSGTSKGANDFKINQYRSDNVELYGPLWIFVTLVIEFIILGYMSNTIEVQKESSKNFEMMAFLAQKATDRSLKRIMKILFLFNCFYLGMPFGSYLMFKGRNAIEVTFVQQLAVFSYAYAPFVPGSLVIFAFQAYYRVKLLFVVQLWIVHLYIIYK
mmetsp:Transcript_3361/g.5622  ORF Transcript_3361/g.5622 Transcript_3361/m.5622 type:complete len:181 (+) Transcript_3361:818-1360(+)